MSHLGLPDTVVDFLRIKNNEKGQKFTWKIFSSNDGYTQITLTWRQPGEHVRPVQFRKKSPSEIKRDTNRRQEFLKTKWSVKDNSEHGMNLLQAENDNRKYAVGQSDLSELQASSLAQVQLDPDPLTQPSMTIDTVPCNSTVSTTKTNQRERPISDRKQTSNVTDNRDMMITRSKVKYTHDPIEEKRGPSECDVNSDVLSTPEKVLCDNMSSSSDENDSYMLGEYESVQHGQSDTVRPTRDPKALSPDSLRKLSEMLTSLELTINKNLDDFKNLII